MILVIFMASGYSIVLFPLSQLGSLLPSLLKLPSLLQSESMKLEPVLDDLEAFILSLTFFWRLSLQDELPNALSKSSLY